MTLKADQGHWSWAKFNSSIGHISLPITGL